MKVKIEESKVIDLAGIVAKSKYANVRGTEKRLRSLLDKSIYTWAGTVGGETACVFGLIAPSVLADQAYLWMITTELAEQHQFLFVRYSQRFIEQVLENFTLIVGDVEVTNDRAKRWLRWLGARINTDMAIDGYAPFTIKAKAC